MSRLIHVRDLNTEFFVDKKSNLNNTGQRVDDDDEAFVRGIPQLVSE